VGFGFSDEVLTANQSLLIKFESNKKLQSLGNSSLRFSQNIVTDFTMLFSDDG